MQFIVLIADICDSKELSERRAVQARLQESCTALNHRLGPGELLSPFTITLGDELQAVFARAGMIWRSVLRLEADMRPVRLRLGLGIGAIDTDINPDAAIGMDGPAFHHAREAVSSLKSDDGNYRVFGLEHGTALARHALDLVSVQRETWNDNRVAIFDGLLDGRSAKLMAQELGISEQAVYKNIRQGRLDTIAGVLQGVGALLDEQLVARR